MSILSQQKQSVSADFPNVRPSLDLRFALAKKLDPRITFTRGSSGTYFGPDGLMRSAGVNEPRFDHDPITGQSLGLLVEESRSNLITHSASTSGIVLGVIGSGGSLPTGWIIDQGQSGTFLEVVGYGVENGLNYIDLKFFGVTTFTNRWLIRPGNGVTLTSGVTYNSSLYAKIISGTIPQYCSFSVFGGFGGAGLTQINSTLTRYSGSSASGSTGTYYPRLDIGFNSNKAIMNFTIRVAGFQAEVGSFPTSYIPTSGSTVTRSADVASMTGTNFSSWYNPNEGTLYANAKSNANTLNNQITGVAALNNSSDSTTNRVDLRYYQSGSQTFFNGVNGGGSSLSRTSGFSLTNPKFIVSYASQNVNFAANASLISSRTSAFVPSPLVNTLRIGTFDAGNSYYLNGTISRLTYYPIALTPTQLINLTS